MWQKCGSRPLTADPGLAHLPSPVDGFGVRQGQVDGREPGPVGGRLALTLTRPGRLVGRSAQGLRMLADAGEGADAPLLAFGFALRLVERLAAEAGGTLSIHDDRLRLTLPRQALPARRRIILM